MYINRLKVVAVPAPLHRGVAHRIFLTVSYPAQDWGTHITGSVMPRPFPLRIINATPRLRSELSRKQVLGSRNGTLSGVFKIISRN